MSKLAALADNGGHLPTRSPSLSSLSDSSLLSIRAIPSRPKNHKARCCIPTAFTMFLGVVAVLLTISLGRAAYLEQRHATATVNSHTSKVPDYFQTSPELFAGELLCSLVSEPSQTLRAD